MRNSTVLHAASDPQSNAVSNSWKLHNSEYSVSQNGYLGQLPQKTCTQAEKYASDSKLSKGKKNRATQTGNLEGPTEGLNIKYYLGAEIRYKGWGHLFSAQAGINNRSRWCPLHSVFHQGCGVWGKGNLKPNWWKNIHAKWWGSVWSWKAWRPVARAIRDF